MAELSYADAKANLQKGGLTGGALTAANAALDAHYNPPVVTSKLQAVDGDSSGLTSSSSTSRSNESDLGNNITSMMSQAYQGPTNNMKYLDDFDNMFRQSYQSDVNSINQSSDAEIASTEDAQDKETGTTSTQVARLGGYLGDSGSGMGVLTNLSLRHRAEIGDLEAKRQAALQAARDGFVKQSYALAQQKSEEAKQYEQEAYNRRTAFFGTAQKLMSQQAISKAIQGGAKSAQDIFDQLGGQVSIDDINSFLKGVAPDTTGAFKFSNDDVTKLLGSGLSQKDISGVIDYVNENGYDESLRSSLTPSERSMLDDIFYPKTPGTGVGGNLSIAEAKSLGLPTSIIGRSEDQVVSELNSPTPPVWYQQYIQSSWADPSQPVDAQNTDFVKSWNDFRNKVLTQNVTGNSYAVNKAKTSTGGLPSEDDLYANN